MTARVWHDANPTFMDKEVEKVTRGEFVMAATVDTDNLDLAFKLTNTIDKYWPENVGVYASPLASGQKGWRSTSVGDLIETKDGFFMVANIGFKKVTVSEE